MKISTDKIIELSFEEVMTYIASRLYEDGLISLGEKDNSKLLHVTSSGFILSTKDYYDKK